MERDFANCRQSWAAVFRALSFSATVTDARV
jgi:hypothetical protein